ncbi:unnamed protein product [Colias eurytheme]|nr:unnamed protein product [Colias eurytheme]
MTRILCILFFVLCVDKVCLALKLLVSNDGPAVRGSNITFTATPQHRAQFVAKSNVSKWTVEYPRDLYEAGEHTVTVNLMKTFFGMWILTATATTTFQITDSLNGNLYLQQNNLIRDNKFVASNNTVHHFVQLPDNEMQFLKKNASTIITYWFIDFPSLDTTVVPLSNTSDNVTHKISKRGVPMNAKRKHAIKDFICHNSSIVPIGDTYTYGHYQETISIRESISTVNITGLNWLQHGDLLNLQVKYTGSPPFDYCAIYKLGQYNVTGNETCSMKSRTTTNIFPLVHYFSDSEQHTVVVVIENEVGKSVSRATINIYKASVHAQLSVIVVPVAFSLVAVILVVFGVAYYQHRSRHTVEVADFDFGQQVNLDYKTFAERLKDSFRNAFNFRHRDDVDPLTSDARYDSM